MKKIKLIVLLLFVAFSTKAQFRISGKLVQQNDSLGVEYAVLQALDKDSTVLGSTTSNAQGNFSLEIKTAPIGIIIKSLVFQDSIISTPKFPENKHLNLGTITLKYNDHQLGEVTISGEMDQLVHQLGKSTFDFSPKARDGASSGLELLQKVPTIQIDHEKETIKVDGQEDVLLLINGVPQNEHSSLTMLNPKDIVKIELVTAPGGKYGSSYSSIVNVILKDKTPQGFQLRTSLTGDLLLKQTYNSANLSYGIGNLRIFTNYRFGYSNFLMNGEGWRKFKDSDAIQNWKSKNTDQKWVDHSIKYGLDYFLDSLTSISLNCQWRKSHFNDDIEKNIQLENSENDFENQMLQDSRNHRNNYTYSLYFKHQFKKVKDATFDIQADYYRFDNKERSHISEAYPEGKTNDFEQGNDREKEYFRFRTDLKLPFAKIHSLNTGLEHYMQSTNNNGYGPYATDNEYREHRSSAYAEYSLKIKPFLIRTGLRFEKPEMESNGRSLDPDMQLSPYSTLQFNKKGVRVSLDYKQRISYPRFWYTDGNITRVDTFTYRSGNQNLQPVRLHQLTAKLNHNIGKKIKMSYSTTYRFSNNDITTILSPYGEGTWISRPENIGRRTNIYNRININYRPNQNLSFTLFGSASYTRSSIYNNEERKMGSQEGYTTNGEFSFDWTIPKWFNISAGYWFSGRYINFTSIYDGSDYNWINITRKINKRAKIALMMNNLFIPMESTTKTETDFYEEYHFRDTSCFRTIRLRFTYNFSTGKKQRSVSVKNVDSDL